ncbi:MAG TPA: hypothetical protein VMW42_12365 [Desulfatiglandales bacterium]|nr:hypothetical protein [Desulfatiglandales bacterium]
MANTERINALKQVHEAEDSVTNTLKKPGLTAPQRRILDELSDILKEIDKLLLLNELNDSIEELEGKSKKLKAINKRIKKQIENLEEVADKVEKAAKAIDAIVKAFGALG